MAFWPRDERTESKDPREESQEKKREYPYLQPGLTGSARLLPENFEWTFLSNPLLPERGQRIRVFSLFQRLYPQISLVDA